MTRSLAVEWGHAGIRVNAIAPGPIPTEGAFSRLMASPEAEKNALGRIPLARFGKPEEIANLATFLLSDLCPYQTGRLRHDGRRRVARGSGRVLGLPEGSARGVQGGAGLDASKVGPLGSGDSVRVAHSRRDERRGDVRRRLRGPEACREEIRKLALVDVRVARRRRGRGDAAGVAQPHARRKERGEARQRRTSTRPCSAPLPATHTTSRARRIATRSSGASSSAGNGIELLDAHDRGRRRPSAPSRAAFRS